MRRHLVAIGAFTTVVVALAAMSGQREDEAALRAALDEAIHHAAERNPASRSSLDRWYALNDHQLSWNGGRHFAAAVAVLDEAASHGLSADPYDISTIRALRQRLSTTVNRADRLPQKVALDVRATAALLAIGLDVSIGRTPPQSLMRTWKRGRSAPDVVSTLADARARGRMRDWLNEVAPRHPEYRSLRGWLDEVRRTNPTDPRVDQIAANLERWRWVADDLGDRHLIINIPEFMLRAREGERTVLALRVVVGKPGGHETPVISGDLQSVVFNPYWNIPESILLAETMPAIAMDRDYLERNDMEVIPISSTGGRPMNQDDVDWNSRASIGQVRVRQRPGAGNALGKVKFPFSNDHAVYLHDTPSTALFARESRAFSHGCVRVADPMALATYVMSGTTTWTPDRISRVISTGAETHTRVARPLPVHLVYFTVIAGPDGAPVYLKDIYGIDRKQLNAVVPPRSKGV